MAKHKAPPIVTLQVAAALRDAARDSLPVSGLTHNYYRYPARFSPQFVRAAIKAFTEPGDLVVDPFMGGGTTLVEAISLGRRAIGLDNSSLATFVTQVKTAIYSDSELDRLRCWAKSLPNSINIHNPSAAPKGWIGRGYLKHLDQAATWRIRKATEQALSTISSLESRELENFARCVILRTGQWALDGRKKMPTIEAYRNRLVEFAKEMLLGATEFRNAAKLTSPNNKPQKATSLHRSAIGLEIDPVLAKIRKIRLIITSPPYPGIHVLYHRWQVGGGKETPAPFWIANQLDGSGAKYYTMGDRREPGLQSYYQNLEKALCSIRKICDPSTTIVQVVAFTEPTWQLPKFLEVMNHAGFEEALLPGMSDSQDQRLWRNVPNRKWHADQLGETPGSRELVLIHMPVSYYPASPALADK